MNGPLRTPTITPAMSSKKVTRIRERALDRLNRLHLDFVSFGCLQEAGPLLHQLMTIAYYAARPANDVQVPQTSAKRTKAAPKQRLDSANLSGVNQRSAISLPRRLLSSKLRGCSRLAAEGAERIRVS